MNDRADAIPPRADLVGAIGWIVLGVAVVAGALAMDRLEALGATLYTAPGLVPGLLGGAIGLLGVVLAVRAIRSGALRATSRRAEPAPEERAARVRTALAMVFTLAYTLGMFGRVPYPVATTVFVFAFIVVFDRWSLAPRPLGRRLLVAAIIALLTSAVVSLVFERIFLVRLP